MSETPATTTYLIAEPFDSAAKSVRAALSAARLRVVGELDLSGRIHRKFLLQTAPCLVLFASPSAPESVELFADPRAGAVTPLHIVVSARGQETEVHVLRFLPSGNGLLGEQAAAVFGRVQAALSRALESLGMRAGLSVRP